MAPTAAEETNEMGAPQKSCVDDFERLKVVGTGAYGKVYQVRHKLTGEILAMKVCGRPTRKSERAHLKEERRVLETVKSPFLCEMKYFFKANHKRYFVLEFLPGGELFSILSREYTLKEKEMKFYVAQIILGLKYLHEHDIIYRDLKASNILLDQNGHIKLVDFGLSKRVKKGTKTSTFCGTFECMAPEMVKVQPYDHSVDYWALGILMYDMMTGSPPFVGKTRMEQRDSIVCGWFDKPKGLSNNGLRLLEGLLTTNASKRWSFEEIKSSVFYIMYNWEWAFDRDAYSPPFKPDIKNDEDTSQFEARFTEMSIEDSPKKENKKEQKEDPFAGF